MTRPDIRGGPTLERVTIELSIENPCVPQMEADPSVRAVWDRLSVDATSSRNEPLIAGLVLDLIDGCDDLGESLARLAASRIATPEIGRHVLEKEIRAVLVEHPRVLEAVAADLVVSFERNPAYPNYLVPYLFAKGFLGLQVHRVAHEMWNSGRVMAASFLQSRISEVFAMDIHPAARVGSGILVDHATGIVIGETCVIGDGVSILQGVTRRQHEDRHLAPGVVPQPLANLIAIHAGKHNVQHDQVVVTRRRQMQATQAVLRAIDAIALELQVIEHVRQNVPIVFYHQNAHRRNHPVVLLN